MIIDDILSINKNNFKKWQDADILSVTNIFSLYEQIGNSDLSVLVEKIFNSGGGVGNEFLHGVTFNTSSELGLLESIINGYIESGLITHDPKSMRGVCNTHTVDRCVLAHQVMIYTLSVSTLRLLESLSPTSFNTSYELTKIAKTVCRKQMDYGTSNIFKFGVWGLVVRMHDKIGRLENLISSGRVNLVEDETIFDTLQDLIGYSILYLMWINDWFLLPMDYEYDWKEIYHTVGL